MRRQRPPGHTTASGHGAEHQALRRAWKPTVDQGRAQCREIICLEPTRWIKPGTPWDLAHDRNHPGKYLGPAHARCNRAEGARHGNRARAGRRQPHRSGSSYAIPTVTTR